MHGTAGGIDRVEIAPAPGRWGMVVRGFLCQNLIIGCCFGGFGVSMATLRDHYQASTATTSLALTLAVVATSLVSPITAMLIGRVGLRVTMMAGALLSVLGYLLLAFAPSMGVVLVAFALLVGPGIAMCGTFPSSVLASNWFQPNPGRAVGIVNMPVMVALVPLIALGVLEQHGLRGFYLLLAGMCALLIPTTWGIRTAPAGAGDMAAAQAEAAGGEAAGLLPVRALIRKPSFWMILIGVGLLTAVGIIGVAHIVAFARERGVPPAEAALLISIMGGASVLGSLLSGLLCDRIGPARTLALIGVGFCLAWSALSATTLLPPMILATLILGASGGGTFPALNVICSQLYGVATLPRAIGLFSILTLPLLFALPPLAGLIHDAANSYQPVVVMIIGICGPSAIGFYTLGRIITRRLALHGLAPARV